MKFSIAPLGKTKVYDVNDTQREMLKSKLRDEKYPKIRKAVVDIKNQLIEEPFTKSNFDKYINHIYGVLNEMKDCWEILDYNIDYSTMDEDITISLQENPAVAIDRITLKFS